MYVFIRIYISFFSFVHSLTPSSIYLPKPPFPAPSTSTGSLIWRSSSTRFRRTLHPNSLSLSNPYSRSLTASFLLFLFSSVLWPPLPRFFFKFFRYFFPFCICLRHFLSSFPCSLRHFSCFDMRLIFNLRFNML